MSKSIFALLYKIYCARTTRMQYDVLKDVLFVTRIAHRRVISGCKVHTWMYADFTPLPTNPVRITLPSHGIDSAVGYWNSVFVFVEGITSQTGACGFSMLSFCRCLFNNFCLLNFSEHKHKMFYFVV